jgi:hypothetical protein
VTHGSYTSLLSRRIVEKKKERSHAPYTVEDTIESTNVRALSVDMIFFPGFEVGADLRSEPGQTVVLRRQSGKGPITMQAYPVPRSMHDGEMV